MDPILEQEYQGKTALDGAITFNPTNQEIVDVWGIVDPGAHLGESELNEILARNIVQESEHKLSSVDTSAARGDREYSDRGRTLRVCYLFDGCINAHINCMCTYQTHRYIGTLEGLLQMALSLFFIKLIEAETLLINPGFLSYYRNQRPVVYLNILDGHIIKRDLSYTINYVALLEYIFKLLHGITDQNEEDDGIHIIDPLDASLSSYYMPRPLALSSSGRYTLPCTDHFTALCVQHGPGGIFIDNRCVRKIDPSHPRQPADPYRSSEQYQFTSSNFEEHSKFPIIFTTFTKPDPLLDLPIGNGDKLCYTRKLWKLERASSTTIVAWTITVRDGPEIATDSLISPLEFIKNLLRHNSVEPVLKEELRSNRGAEAVQNSNLVDPATLSDYGPSPKIAIYTLDSWIFRTFRHLLSEKTPRVIILARNDKVLELLATNCRPLGIIIRHTANMCLEESIRTLLSVERGAIIMV